MFGIKKDIARAVNKIGLGRELEAFMVCSYGQKTIAKVCEDGCLDKIKVAKYIKSTHTLEIELTNIIIGHKIRNKKKLITERINNKLGGMYVKNIRFRIG